MVFTLKEQYLLKKQWQGTVHRTLNKFEKPSKFLSSLQADGVLQNFARAQIFCARNSHSLLRGIQGRINGVTVEEAMDARQIKSNQGGEYDLFAQAGYDVHTDGIEGLMHHKVFIIDEQIVITGSYNFSRSAEERNDENIIVIYNTDIAQEFLKEFGRVQAQAQTEE